MTRRVLGYLGPSGTFTEEVAMSYSAGRGFLLKPLAGFERVVSAVQNESVQEGILPVENSLEGSVNLTLDLLAEAGGNGVMISGEFLFRVRQNLISQPGVELRQVREVYSHPQALAQCRAFLSKELPDTVPMHTTSTAEAATTAARGAGRAAIASRRVAALYGLQVIAKDIQDEENNITRFLLLGRADSPPTGNDKTSLLLGLHDRPGSLYSLLGIFSRYGLNLTKIESRPHRGELGKYKFFLDVEGHRRDSEVESALAEVEKEVLFLNVLGSYPKDDK